MATKKFGTFGAVIQVDENGDPVVPATGASADQVQGTVADDAPDTGNPVKTGGVYKASLVAHTAGDRMDFVTDPYGALRSKLTGATNTLANGMAFSNYTYVVGDTSQSAGGPLVTLPVLFNGTSYDRAIKPNLNTQLVSSAATTNATLCKNSAADLFHVRGYNGNAAIRYLKLFNKATAPTVGTDSPVMTLALPATAVFDIALPAMYFSLGLGFALTTGSALLDTGAVGAGDILGLNLLHA